MNNETKIKYYDILNSIKMEYLKSDMPYNIINDRNIILTYDEINLKYIANKNYFVTINKTTKYNPIYDKTNDKSRNPPGTRVFTPEETAVYLKRRESYKKGGNLPIMLYS